MEKKNKVYEISIRGRPYEIKIGDKLLELLIRRCGNKKSALVFLIKLFKEFGYY